MLEFGGHGQDDRAERVAGSAEGIGDLLGVPTLMSLSATGAEAALDVKLDDDRHNGWQIGLILYVDFGIDQFDVTGWTKSARHLDDAIDLLGRRCRPKVALVSVASARFLASFLELFSTKDAGLSMRLSACFVEFGA
jgi:hypothetical protein